MIDLTKLTTEQRNPNSMELDKMSALEIVTLMNQEDNNVIKGVKEVLPQVAQACQWASESILADARIIYIGAGTSGRLGLLDAVECPPTFGVDPSQVVGLLAGGPSAFVKAAEGTEDKEYLGAEELKKINLTKEDIVIGLAASGRTPYVIGGLNYANELGCKTVAIACNKNSKIGTIAKLAIEPVAGPEVLIGSTRLKSGTSQKMVLNMISTCSMILAGKVYENLMVDVKPTNEKLAARATNIIVAAIDCTLEKAEETFEKADRSVKVAIVMILLDCDANKAKELLDKNHGFIRKALDNK